jgi:hypothetical protein
MQYIVQRRVYDGLYIVQVRPNANHWWSTVPDKTFCSEDAAVAGIEQMKSVRRNQQNLQDEVERDNALLGRKTYE